MKTLNNYINEWRANTNTVSSIKKPQYFIYEIHKLQQIKIYNSKYWPYHTNYDDKVYVNGNKVDLDSKGCTKTMYNEGRYIVEIKDINDVINCNNMFFNCTELISVPLFDTSKVKNMNEMFSYCEKLKQVPLFDTSKVESMNLMFSNCYKLKDVPLFNTSKVTDMSFMFSDCYELEKVPKFDTRNVTQIYNMFSKCHKLSDKTKQEWSSIYDFETNKIKMI